MENLWDGKNDLPAVGEVVEFYHEEHDRKEGICVDAWKNGDKLECLAIRKVKMDNLPVFFNMRDQTASCLIRMRYRPIKSDREKSIEAAIEGCTFYVVEGDIVETYRRAFEQAYDLGLLRLPEDK
jgi:hypothetical protein